MGKGIKKRERPARVNWLFRLWGIPLEKAARELASIQAMDPDAGREWQQRKAWEMARYHYQQNPWYREKVGPRFPDRWEDLPLLERKDFQAPLSRRATPFRGRVYQGSTSGSSGQPMAFYKDAYSHAMTWALIESLYRESGLGWEDHQARFYGMPSEGISAWKERIKDGLLRRTRFPVKDLGPETLARWKEQWQRARFDYFYGYTSVLVHIARWMVEQGLHGESWGLKKIILTSELCLPEDREWIRKAWGKDPIREYGVSELCLLGFDRKGKFDLNQETLLIEITGDQGQRGRQEGSVAATSLFNRAFPMVRYQPGDQLRIGKTKGRHHIESMQGRTSDMIHLPGGGRAAGLNFYYLAREMLTARYPVQEFRVRQTRVDRFDLDYTAPRPLREEEKAQIGKWITEILGYCWTIHFHHREEIPAHPLGKKQHFYCEIPHS